MLVDQNTEYRPITEYNSATGISEKVNFRLKYKNG